MKVLIEGGSLAQQRKCREWLKGVAGVHLLIPLCPEDSHHRSLLRLLPLCRPDLVVMFWGNNEGEPFEDTSRLLGQTRAWVFYGNQPPKARVTLLKPVKEVTESWFQQVIRAEQARWRKLGRHPEPHDVRQTRIARRQERQRANLELAQIVLKSAREVVRELTPFVRRQRRLLAA